MLRFVQLQAPSPPAAMVLSVWREMVSTMATAHQRRGEGDLVAIWLYQVLALDPDAPEWRAMVPES